MNSASDSHWMWDEVYCCSDFHRSGGGARQQHYRAAYLHKFTGEIRFSGARFHVADWSVRRRSAPVESVAGGVVGADALSNNDSGASDIVYFNLITRCERPFRWASPTSPLALAGSSLGNVRGRHSRPPQQQGARAMRWVALHDSVTGQAYYRDSESGRCVWTRDHAADFAIEEVDQFGQEDEVMLPEAHSCCGGPAAATGSGTCGGSGGADLSYSVINHVLQLRLPLHRVRPRRFEATAGQLGKGHRQRQVHGQQRQQRHQQQGLHAVQFPKAAFLALRPPTSLKQTQASPLTYTNPKSRSRRGQRRTPSSRSPLHGGPSSDTTVAAAPSAADAEKEEFGAVQQQCYHHQPPLPHQYAGKRQRRPQPSESGAGTGIGGNGDGSSSSVRSVRSVSVGGGDSVYAALHNRRVARDVARIRMTVLGRSRRGSPVQGAALLDASPAEAAAQAKAQTADREQRAAVHVRQVVAARGSCWRRVHSHAHARDYYVLFTVPPSSQAVGAANSSTGSDPQHHSRTAVAHDNPAGGNISGVDRGEHGTGKPGGGSGGTDQAAGAAPTPAPDAVATRTAWMLPPCPEGYRVRVHPETGVVCWRRVQRRQQQHHHQHHQRRRQQQQQRAAPCSRGGPFRSSSSSGSAAPSSSLPASWTSSAPTRVAGGDAARHHGHGASFRSAASGGSRGGGGGAGGAGQRPTSFRSMGSQGGGGGGGGGDGRPHGNMPARQLQQHRQLHQHRHLQTKVPSFYDLHQATARQQRAQEEAEATCQKDEEEERRRRQLLVTRGARADEGTRGAASLLADALVPRDVAAGSAAATAAAAAARRLDVVFDPYEVERFQRQQRLQHQLAVDRVAAAVQAAVGGGSGAGDADSGAREKNGEDDEEAREYDMDADSMEGKFGLEDVSDNDDGDFLAALMRRPRRSLLPTTDVAMPVPTPRTAYVSRSRPTTPDRGDGRDGDDDDAYNSDDTDEGGRRFLAHSLRRHRRFVHAEAFDDDENGDEDDDDDDSFAGYDTE